MVLLILACVVSGFVISCLATAGMRWLAPRVGLIDQPNAARKVHVNPTPLGWGFWREWLCRSWRDWWW
jgi:UDP-N-acetylmuramyl pentapeptide phosphotransferase/UDP-N-acetylglucosamine-1-phosphate transferase